MLMDKERLIEKGTPSDHGAEREYERLMSKRRDEMLARVEEGYKQWKETKTYKVPEWLYGPPKGKLFRVACEDVPNFGDTSYLEFDSARTALVSIDFQIDFCGEKGYVDVMGYPLSNTANPLTYAKKALKDARDAGISVVHCREGHMPDLSDCPYNKILRSKIIGKDAVGIGEQPKGRANRGRNTRRQGWERRRLLQRLLSGSPATRYLAPHPVRHHDRCLRAHHDEGGQ